MISTLWNSVTSALAGLPESDLLLEPGAWMMFLGGGLLVAANLWMWLVPVPRASFVGGGTTEDSLRGGLACSSASLVLLATGLTWALLA